MHDRNPIKALLCVRDIYIGIMYPWNLGQDHRAIITQVRDELESAAEQDINDEQIFELLQQSLDTATEIADSCRDVRNVYNKMDNARLMIKCVLAEYSRLVKQD